VEAKVPLRIRFAGSALRRIREGATGKDRRGDEEGA
jgi:hypothetical protein